MLDILQEAKVHLVIQAIQVRQVTSETALQVPPDSQAPQAQKDVRGMGD